jgi:hypothetical protein
MCESDVRLLSLESIRGGSRSRWEGDGSSYISGRRLVIGLLLLLGHKHSHLKLRLLFILTLVLI